MIALRFIAAALVILSAGCATRTVADPRRGIAVDAPQLRSEIRWPARRPNAVIEVVERVGAPRNADAADRIPWKEVARLLGARNADGDFDFLAGMCYCHGVLGEGVVFESLLSDPGSGFHILVNSLTADELDATLHATDDVPFDRRPARFAGRLTLPPATDDGDDGIRGLIVHLGSLGDRRYEYRVLRPLLERDWGVLEVVPRGFSFRVVTDDDSLVDLETFCGQFDRALADYAYAVEAAWLYARELTGSSGAPVVVLGFSLGALAAPAVTVRLDATAGVRPSALVLVGGGANLARVLFEGSLFAGSVNYVLRHLDRDARAQLQDHIDAYLDRAFLDPYALAQALADIPTLLLHASYDAIVPAWTGDLLYERLDRPERWSFPAGHLGLFWLVPNEADAIADWVDRTVPRP